MAEEEVRTALIEVLGEEAARDFSPAEVGKLRMNGYKNARSLRKASREGLRFISLPEARIDDIVNARGDFTTMIMGRLDEIGVTMDSILGKLVDLEDHISVNSTCLQAIGAKKLFPDPGQELFATPTKTPTKPYTMPPASPPSSGRAAKFKQSVETYNGCRSGEDNLVECMVTGKRFPAFYAKAGHLVKCANPKESKEVLGTSVNDQRNGIVWVDPLEQMWGQNKICILKDPKGRFWLHVLDDNISDTKLVDVPNDFEANEDIRQADKVKIKDELGDLKFGDLTKQPLNLVREGKGPFQRAMSAQACTAHRVRQMEVPDEAIYWSAAKESMVGVTNFLYRAGYAPQDIAMHRKRRRLEDLG